MFDLRRIAFAVAALCIVADCSRGAVIPPGATAPAGAMPDAKAVQNLRVVAGLVVTVNGGVASFAAARTRPVYTAPASQSLTIPAMTIDLCPLYQRASSTPCPSPTASPTPIPMLGTMARISPSLRPLPQGTYYLVVQPLPGTTRIALSGPGTVAGQTVTLPGSNATFAVSADQRYKFLLVSASGTIATPTPSPTPTPLADQCPAFAGTIAPAPAPASTPAAVLVSPPPINFMSNYQFSETAGLPIYRVTCGPAQLLYFSAGPGGTISTYDPVYSSIRNIGQIAGVPAGATLMVSAHDRLNNLYATAVGASQPYVYEISYDGARQSSAPLPSSFIDVPLAEGADGNVYGVGSTGTAAQIFRITADLSVTTLSAPAGCTHPFAMVSGSDSQLWILDSACGLFKISTAGAASIVSARLGFDANGFDATALAQGPDGAFYAAVPGAIQRADQTSGTMSTIALPPEAASVQAMVAGPDHRLWLSASGDSQLGVMARLDLASGVLVEWPSTMGYGNDSGGAPTNPAYLVIGPDGNLYGTDRGIEGSVMKLQPALAGR